MILKIFLWASFVGIIAFFSHKQLSTQVVSFDQTIFIPGSSKLVVYEYFKDVQNSMKSIQNGDTVSGVVYIPGEGGEPDKIKFNRLERFSIQGLYEQILESPCIAKLFPNVPKIQLQLNFFEGLIHGTVNIVFREGSQNGLPGTVVTQYFEIVTPNFFSKFIQDNTKSTYQVFLQNAKRHLQDRET
ncbi:Hypothetical predicted protein [Paramuricea clavata]|uniref:Uncharacterized protein n=1 Tax=Paramuricea clavata TaxID=317549 RepID=A0A7D9IM80_PARCT|nr:Hypothetical predicted protein [Paramuricea clavata]